MKIVTSTIACSVAGCDAKYVDEQWCYSWTDVQVISHLPDKWYALEQYGHCWFLCPKHEVAVDGKARWWK